jgi:ABC-type transporter Mla subunit MlaD
MKHNARFEILAGTFLLVGLGTVGTFIIWLGESPDLFRPTYNLMVLLPDASGLVRGSDVYLSGALIGREAANPQVMPNTNQAEVRLKIDREVRLRRDTAFSVGNSGLFGDKFVKVSPKKHERGKATAPFITNGEVITGIATPTLQSLEGSASPLILRSRHIATQVDKLVSKFKQQVLTADTIENLKATMAGFKTLTIDRERIVANAKDICAHVRSGHGALGRLLYDKNVRSDLTEFMTNLRAYGPIFYRDAAPGEASTDKIDTETPRERYEGN